VTRQSDALDLDRGVFKQTSARKIAASLKRSAERSKRRKAPGYRSALLMLIFHINRAGKNLPKAQRDRLERQGRAEAPIRKSVKLVIEGTIALRKSRRSGARPAQSAARWSRDRNPY
jgi:Protein of unknown function (DUF3175)